MKTKIKTIALSVIILALFSGTNIPKAEAVVRENSQKTAKTTNVSYDRFSGTYFFTRTVKGTPTTSNEGILVMKDGRCFRINRNSTEKEYLGKITPISKDAFRISGTNETFGYGLDFYKNGKWCHNFKGAVYKPLVSKFTFNIAEGKAYPYKNEYENRDVVSAEYSPMTHSSSTTY